MKLHRLLRRPVAGSPPEPAEDGTQEHAQDSLGEPRNALSILIARSFLFMRDRAAGSTLAFVLLLIDVAVVVASAALSRRHQHAR